MMYDRQQELDNCRDYSNHKSAIIKTKDQTIAMLAKDLNSRRRHLDKKERIIARLRHRISDLEETIHERYMQVEERENAGEDLRGDPYSYLSDDDDFLEDQAMDFFMRMISPSSMTTMMMRMTTTPTPRSSST